MRVVLADIAFSGDLPRRKIWENNFETEILLGRIIIMHEDGRLEIYRRLVHYAINTLYPCLHISWK